MTGFRKIRFDASDSLGSRPRVRNVIESRSAKAGGGRIPNVSGPAGPLSVPSASPPHESHEKASLEYVQTYLQEAGSEQLEALTTPGSPDLVPDFGLTENVETPVLAARALSFEQNWKGIPVFGGRVSIDVRDSDRTLISINGQFATPPDQMPTADLSPAAARDHLVAWAATGELPPDTTPRLTWYYAPERDTWFLAWHFASVLLTPPAEAGTSPMAHDHDAGHEHEPYCLGPSPRSRQMLIDAFVDTADGAVVYYFPSTATLHVPIPMTGDYNQGRNRDFFGSQSPRDFALSDPIRNIVTYDFAGADIDANASPPLPPDPVEARNRDLAANHPAAVSAHYHSTLVYRDLPGALNESFSDIFGRIVANWFPNRPNNVETWDWQLGKTLGLGGGPLRDMKDPSSAGGPDHMSLYVPLPYNNDYGGVHKYSGIHNKAIHHLLTDKVNGELTFPARDAVLVLYLTLVRLTRTSDFTDCRRTMENVTRAYYGRGPELLIRLDAIQRAYGSVGL
ncbi:MAG: M4 family metallopeptidase [Pseudomonadota bacterium]